MIHTVKQIWSALFLASLILTGCAVNPVTGKHELSLISEDREIQMGQENYAPAQQSQGGQYSVDPAVTSYVAAVGKKLAAASDRPQLPFHLNGAVHNDLQRTRTFFSGL